MKKQLLMLGLGLLGSVTMSAQLTSPFTGTRPVAEVNSKADYYLYNVKSGKWLQNNDDNISATPNDGSRWTTRGELGTRGMDWEVTCKLVEGADAMYQLNPKFRKNNSMNWDNLYLDTNAALTQWIIEPADDANVPNAVRICANAGEYPYLYVGADGWLVSGQEYDGENDVWQFVTREERIEYMKKQAELNGSADATWLIGCPQFANQDSRYDKWIRSISGDQLPEGHKGPASGNTGDGMVNCNRVYEMWSSYSASITQTLSDIPNGTYGMTLQGYYREGSADDVKDWDGNS